MQHSPIRSILNREKPSVHAVHPLCAFFENTVLGEKKVVFGKFKCFSRLFLRFSHLQQAPSPRNPPLLFWHPSALDSAVGPSLKNKPLFRAASDTPPSSLFYSFSSAPKFTALPRFSPFFLFFLFFLPFSLNEAFRSPALHRCSPSFHTYALLLPKKAAVCNFPLSPTQIRLFRPKHRGFSFFQGENSSVRPFRLLPPPLIPPHHTRKMIQKPSNPAKPHLNVASSCSAIVSRETIARYCTEFRRSRPKKNARNSHPAVQRRKTTQKNASSQQKQMNTTKIAASAQK